MKTLEELRRFDLARPSAALWNAMLEQLQRRTLRLTLGWGGGQALPHPWQTQCTRWEAPVEMVKERAWRVDIRAGWVNDEPALVPYHKEGDPRGWRRPDGYPLPGPREEGYDARWVGRWMNEKGDPPFLTIEAPAQGETETQAGRALAASWERVSEPPAYFAEFYPDSVIFRATVLVTAAAVSPRELVPAVAAPQVGPHRLGCGKRPDVVNVPVGGFLELAWLWLIREPQRQDPAEDEVLVEQLVFYDLATQFVDNATRWWTA